jgi:hypothetical protein
MSFWKKLFGGSPAIATQPPKPTVAPTPPKPTPPPTAKIRVPKPAIVYVAGNGFMPKQQDLYDAVGGFFAYNGSLEPELPPGSKIEGFIGGMGGADIKDLADFGDSALNVMFSYGKHPNCYYLDTMLQGDGLQIMVVMLWEGEEARLAKQQIPGGKQRGQI